MSDEQHGGPSEGEHPEQVLSEGDPAEGETSGGADSERGLSELDLAVLALERRAFSGPGAKERAVRERLGMTPTRYYQLLNALLDDPRALAHDPVTVNRLRRIRDARRERR
ncbi:DUF3263 domain-containing protein [Streptomyces roseoverticillatus]|uniref:DUF3263 domain-containing protein n=1 Tax=Streptomyces roseoverticillatus TaxID=66429 RepID=UPI001F22B6F5|nr:DUF3263 domain-containing protein [Streptomyces roseoverticillatus]MCF3106866.1 DUF3263 domain-containing protein [Streptomyces roseoverticillatus]